uniref:S4 RNA-binding domain-containing protein n=1 Tax=Angiostrongylus cantonensis TaxID=6313 RepID=A0A0K0DBB3_ANGCA
LLCSICFLQRLKTVIFCRQFRTSPLFSSQEVGDDGLPKDYKLKILKAGSRRLDTFVNRASGMSSSSVISKLILGGRVRVNEDILTKRSYNVRIVLFISFFQVVNYDVTESGYDIQIKSWKKFLVENWRGS